MAAFPYAQRNYILRCLHSNLILVSLDGLSLGFCIKASVLCTIPSGRYNRELQDAVSGVWL